MPKTLKEFYNEKIAALDARRNQVPRVDYQSQDTTYAQSFEYITKLSAIAYEQAALDRSIAKAMNETLTDEQIGAIYDKLHNEETRSQHTKARFVRLIRDELSNVSGYTIAFGVSLDQLMDAIESELGAQKTQEIMQQPPGVAPTDPRYTGSRVVKPQQARLDALEEELLAKEPDETKKQEIRKLFSTVSSQLENPDPELLAFYNDAYNSNVPGAANSFIEILDRKPGYEVQQGISNLSGGKIADAVNPGTNKDGSPDYAPLLENQIARELSDEEKAQLQHISSDPQTGLSQSTLDAVDQLSGQFDQLDYSTQPDNTLMKAAFFPTLKHPAEDQLAYAGEQGAKYYAFWPLVYAKDKLIAAVEAKDPDAIREWSAEYGRLDGQMQQMIDTVHSKDLSQDPNFSGNVNSTRSDTGLMPEKYASDYIGHNKLNSVYTAHAFSKNTGISMREMASDPYGSALKASRTYLDANGTDSRPDSIGAALSLNSRVYSEHTGDFMIRNFGMNVYSAFSRGGAGIASLEKDPEKRNRFLALQYLGVREGQKELRKEKDLQNALYDVMNPRSLKTGLDPLEKSNPKKRALREEKRAAIYANAAILPETGEDRFNMRKIAESLAKTGAHADDWRQDLSVEAYLDGTKPVDYAALAERNKKILRDMEEEKKASGHYKSFFDRDEYLRTAFRCHSKLLQNAPDRVKQTAGFQAFKKSVLDMYQLAESEETRSMLKVGAQAVVQGDFFDFLKTGKQDQISKTDTPEYRRMKGSLDAARRHLEDLRSDDHKEYTSAAERSFPETLQQAADDSFDYFRKKVKNGSKHSFTYKSGERRAREALKAVVSIRKAQDELGLRSPAQKMYEDSQLELMLHRDNEVWMAQYGAKYVAQMLYAGKYLEAGVPIEEQKEFFEKEAQTGVQRLMNTEAIQMYVRDHKVYQLANSALDGEYPFTMYQDTVTKDFAGRYEAQMQPYRLKKEHRTHAENYSLDLAAKELNIDGRSGYCSPENPRVTEKAKEIRKRPAFKETMAKVFGDKSLEQLKQDREYQFDVDRMKEFDKASAALEYEKTCAKASVRNMLQAQGNAQPSEEQLETAANKLRKDARFKQFCKAELYEKDLEDIQEMNEDMKKDQVRQDTVGRICNLFVAPPELDLSEPPKVPQKGSAQAEAGNGSVQVQVPGY